MYKYVSILVVYAIAIVITAVGASAVVWLLKSMYVAMITDDEEF